MNFSKTWALLAVAGVLGFGREGLRAVEKSSFQAGDGGWHLGALAAGNLDGDAQLEIVIPYRNTSGAWFLDAFKPNGTRLPGFPFVGDAEINVSPTLYDLDDDGRDEIVFTCGTRVIALRGDGTVIWSTPVNHSNYVPDSGYMAVTNGFYWSDGGGFISRLPATAVFSSQVSSPIIADVNGDGRKEIVTAWKIDPDSTSSHQDFNPFINDIWGFGEWGTVGEVWSGGVVFFDAATGAKTYTYHFHQLVESGLALGQADADLPLETYVLNDSDSVVAFDKTRPHGFHGNGNLHKQFGKNQRLMSGSYQVGVDIYAVDIDGDGLSEVLAPTTHRNSLWQPSETILDDDGAVLWRRWNQPVSYAINQWQNSAAMIPVNPDRDNRMDVLSFTHSYEIAFRSWNGVELVDRPGWPRDFYPYLPTPPVVGDVDGDGQEEIVIGTYNPAQTPSDGNLHVFALDGTQKFSVPVPGGLKHIPTIANVYGNGLDVVYRSLAGKVYIQNFGSTGPGPVSWATHRGNRQRDGNLGVSLFPSGTPLVTSKESGFRRAGFSWTNTGAQAVSAWRIYRAERPDGALTHIATLTADATSYTDFKLKSGAQYIYEVAAVFGANEVHSTPFAVLASCNGNLIANGGFEENDNSHWDKWFTGEIEWTNMVASSEVVYQGRKAMEITLRNKGSNGTISQYGQYGTIDAYLPVTPGRLYSFGGFLKSGGVSQPTGQWLEWGSAKTGENTNNRPALPYPNYFTPHLVAGTNATEWTYANRTFVMPAGFPNVELWHRYSIAASGSGTMHLDDLFFRALPPLNSGDWTELIPFRSIWRYSTNTPAADWFSTSFNDSTWPSGTAKFGAGSGPTNITTMLPSRQPAYYFRRTFAMPAERCEELLLSATCTDAGKPLEVYLNGVKLVTSGIEVVSGQGNEVRYYDLAPFLHLLQPGDNTIAVMVSNGWQPTWDDVAYDLSLKTIARVISEPRLSIVNQPDVTSDGENLTGAQTEVLLNISVPSNTVWRVESADKLSGPWQLVEVITGTTANALTVRDSGQNGRLPPSQVPTRFYRLVPG